MKNIFIKLGEFVSIGKGTTTSISNPLKYIFNIFVSGLKNDGLLSSYKQTKLFSSWNKGLLLDGKSKRLSLKESFNHLALISRTGGGKTTSYVVPNIFKLANEKNSMVITDISGELYEKTSGYLHSKGYKVYVLNPEDLSESIGYNPLACIKSSIDIDEIATILLKSNQETTASSSKDVFWENSAKTAISLFIKLLLLNKNPRQMNLANVRYIANNFGIDGENLKEIFKKVADVKLQEEFTSLRSINPNTLTSIMANVNSALNPIGINDNLEKLTANHTINFNKFRKEKSVIYIKIPGHKQRQYKFLLNIFYQQFFNHMMSSLPQENDLPIFCLLDEFGNMNLPNFDNTITTIRKYRVSISIILQDVNQLEKVYSTANAKTILYGGISSKLYYSGAGLETIKELSEILGTMENIDGKEEVIMKPNEIRTMGDDEALFISSNLLPAKFKVKPYFDDFLFSQYSKITPFKIPLGNHLEEVDFIEIYSRQD